ncbi:LytTR family transcriptional regulator [Maribacter algarum]|uniref:LytTR family transcriptional regulator n=2 Tax=Maribacter algarum (ex Zhang et al. 2020) TaxID=2578118 RepID=A0A5S3PH54_9FLAO|nr:LytTR family transcriptional regulator [Maribacter algarum]
MPSLIFINVDNYSNKDFINPINIIKDLYRSFPKKPELVAIAPSKKQAFNCIKHNFYYYLLHPLNESQLHLLDSRLRIANIPKKDKPKKLCLQTYSDYRFIEINDILYLKADNNSTEFFLTDKTKIVAYKTLKYFESILPKSFRRIHQSFVINQNYISRIHLGKHECHLKPFKMKLPFSRAYRKVMSELATNLSSNALS